MRRVQHQVIAPRQTTGDLPVLGLVLRDDEAAMRCRSFIFIYFLRKEVEDRRRLLKTQDDDAAACNILEYPRMDGWMDACIMIPPLIVLKTHS